MPTIRPQVVALLGRIDSLSPDLSPDRWTIHGRPLTDFERKLALSATRDELQAMLDVGQAHVETVTAEIDAGAELFEMLDPYWNEPSETVEQVVAKMPPELRAKAEELQRGLPQWVDIPF
jgi:hypothetical protein